MPEDPDAAIDRQYEELLHELSTIAAARSELAAAQAASPAPFGAWYLRVAVTTTSEVMP